MLVSFGYGSLVRTVMTPVGSNPSGTLSKSWKLRSNRPAAIINTTDSAHSATTSAGRRRACRPEFDPRIEVCSIGMSGRRAARAGAHPKMMPDVIVTSAANTSTLQLRAMSFSRGNPAGMNRTSEAFAINRPARPAAPPMLERHRLSVSSCRIRRLAPAPIACRTANSRRRVLARARRRLATFTQPINRTRPTAASMRISDPRTSPTTVSCSGTNRTVQPLRSEPDRGRG